MRFFGRKMCKVWSLTKERAHSIYFLKGTVPNCYSSRQIGRGVTYNGGIKVYKPVPFPLYSNQSMFIFQLFLYILQAGM